MTVTTLLLSRCPCGSGVPYDACCRPLHEGAAAPTAETLMRSRYTAFARGLGDYIERTWSRATRPAAVELDERLVWRRLQIVDTVRGGEADTTGVVEFRASFRGPEGHGVLHERSRFAREDGRWVYVDGDVLD